MEDTVLLTAFMIFCVSWWSWFSSKGRCPASITYLREGKGREGKERESAAVRRASPSYVTIY
eukprot:3354895-Pyramimonas_sp.AAC.1